MGKGYNNYMCKKPFHPGSKANIKRAWMAEQRIDNDKKKQDELRVQYEKEQDLYNNKALISNESKDKLALNFMYEAPPGAKREHQREDDEPEYKFEWQRKYNAPREDFAKDNKEIRDQPFGIPVRNVRCIKCHQWGHLNTDRECPLFNQASKNGSSNASMDPMMLMMQMKEEGLRLKQEVLGHQFVGSLPNMEMLKEEEEEDEDDPEMAFLKSLSTKQKKKLLRKLNKLAAKGENPQESGKIKKRKSSKKKRKKNKSRSSKNDDTSGSEDNKSSHHKKKKRKHESSSSESDSSSSSSSNSSSSSSDASSSKKKRKHHSSRDGKDKHRKKSLARRK